MKAKTKYKLIKGLMIPATLLHIFIISSIFVVFNVDKLWENMFELGQANILQILTLVLYRVLLYVPLPFIMAIFKFDERYNYSSRLIIWFNKMFLILLVIYAIFDFCSLYLLTKITILESLSSFILLLGYIFTYIKKKPISFDERENILK